MLHITYNYALQTLCGAPHNVCNDNGFVSVVYWVHYIAKGYATRRYQLTSNDFTDLTPQQMKRYEELYHDPQLFFLLGKTLCVEHTTPEEYARVMAPPPKTKESPER